MNEKLFQRSNPQHCFNFHGGAGKTSLAEALLFTSGAINRLGTIETGTTTTDYDPDEIKRQVTINVGLAPLEWDGVKINLLDTPGYFDFIGDLIGALRVADCSAVVVCAVSGVEVGTEKVWQYADDFSLPRLVLINKLDRENADFTGTIAQLQEHFGLNVVPVQMPIGKEDDFKGVIDLIEEKALLFSDGEKTVEEQEIPAELREQAEAMREKLIEAVAETDDDLLLKYLEGEMLEVEEIKQSLRRGILERKITPVLCGSATRNFGSGPLLDFMKSFLPSPLERGELSGILPESGEKITRLPSTEEPFTALVYKTLADPYVGRINYFRVYSGVLSPDSQVYNSNKAKNERVGQVFSMRGKNQIPMEQVVAGDIAAVAKLQHTTTGDTLYDRSSPFQFPPIEFPEPVISLRWSPDKRGRGEGQQRAVPFSRGRSHISFRTSCRNTRDRNLWFGRGCILKLSLAAWLQNSG